MRPGSVGLLSVGILLAAWGTIAQVQAKPTVYVTNYPLHYFATRIAGESVNLVLPVPAHTDPALWQPDVPTIMALQAAALIVLNGATYEKWLEKVTLPPAKLINTSQSFATHYLAIAEATTHSHGPTGVHSHAGTAFTTWLNFRFAAQQAQAIAHALGRLLPAQRDMFTANAAALERDLLALDQRLEAVVATRRTQPLVASHPIYQYLAQRYGLQLRSVLWEPEVMPEESQWQHLRTLLTSHAAQWMLWERQPLAAVAAKLLAMGVQSVVFDPCSNTPAQGDFLTVMQHNVANLQHAWQ